MGSVTAAALVPQRLAGRIVASGAATFVTATAASELDFALLSEHFQHCWAVCVKVGRSVVRPHHAMMLQLERKGRQERTVVPFKPMAFPLAPPPRPEPNLE
eukprot:673266-Amphidinium_carterae.1